MTIKYTKEQIKFLRTGYQHMNVRDLTASFNDRFSVEKTELQIRATLRNKNIRSGRTGHFSKGHTPWNKGIKGLTHANITSFKKGNMPVNRKPVGSERIDSKDGYILIKVHEEDPYTGFPTRYKPKHVHIWEKSNGPVPKGMIIAFIDGNKANCEPENLMLISRAQLLNLNRLGYSGAPDELKPSVLALSKLQIKTYEKQKI